MQAFYGGDPEAWFHAPAWVLKAYAASVPQLHAERQLAAIEAAVAPYMPSDRLRQTLDNYARRADSDRPVRATPELLEQLGIPVKRVPKKEQQRA